MKVHRIITKFEKIISLKIISKITVNRKNRDLRCIPKFILKVGNKVTGIASIDAFIIITEHIFSQFS